MREDLNDFEQLCMVTGYVSIHWAILEQALDMMVAISFHGCGGKALNDEIPRSLEEKVKFLKKSFRKLPPLFDFRDEAIDLLIVIMNKKETRHDVIHGAVTAMESKNGVFRLLRTRYEKELHVSQEVLVDLKKFPALATEIAEMQERTLNLVLRLVRHIFPGELSEPPLGN